MRLTQLNAQLPVLTASSDLMVFYTRIQALISLTQEMAVADMGIFLTGIFNQIAEPNKIIRQVSLKSFSCHGQGCICCSIPGMLIFQTENISCFRLLDNQSTLDRIVYLDRLTKELTASLQQLKSTNQLGTYFCDIVSQSYTLEQNIEYFLHKFAGLSLLEVVNSEEVSLR